MLQVNSSYSNLELFDIYLNRVFHKKMSVLGMDKLFYDEKFECLVVETFDMRCYGFNLKCAVQHATAKKIIQDVNSLL
jgi:hypothetical protein